MSLGNRKFFKVFLLIVVALATGFSIGKIYVSTLEPEYISNYSDEYLMGKDEEEIAKNVAKAQNGASPDSFNALQLYQIAEYNLNHAESFYKVGGGKVDTIISQQQKSEKIKVGDLYVFNKMSPGTVPVCSQIVYDAKKSEIRINDKGTFVDTSYENMSANFDVAKFETWTVEEYEEVFNTSSPANVMPYVICSTTCGQKKFTPITKTADGNYKFQIDIDGQYLTIAATRYSSEIQFSSNLEDKPVWQSLQMTVVVDDNFNFVSIDYVETYKMKYGPMTPTVTDYFSERFYFGNDVPPVSQVLGREVA